MKAEALIVDDERLIRTSLHKAFLAAGYEVTVAGSYAEAAGGIGGARFDLAIVDLRLGDGDGFELIRRLRSESPDTKAIVITAHGNVESAVAAMKLGAYDFVKKPFDLEELLATAGNAVREARLERRVAYHDGRERSRTEEEMIGGRSASARRLEHEIGMVAAQPVPVILVVGETGSGKALVARRLHYGSPRARAPFVELNAAAIPENLVESELFGHERGAFSDARQRKQGLVEVADGGTLFLDEVGDLAPSVQAKLLTFLEGFAFRRVGGTASLVVDVRVVAATNHDLSALVKEGRFRADLYYRLSALTLSVPPLRDRLEDIGPLADHFLKTSAHRYHKRFARLTDEAVAALARWPWPGNVRELKAVIQRAVLMNEGDRLGLDHLPADVVSAAVDPIPAALASGGESLPTLEEIELKYMRAVLDLVGGNKVRAAERLGISRQTLGKRLGEAE